MLVKINFYSLGILDEYTVHLGLSTGNEDEVLLL